jgi:membrane protease YdiL (CAAX protease family)
MGMVALLYFTTQWLGVEPENPYQDIPEHNLEILSWLALVSAPFIEELVFRGFLQTTLYRYFHPAVAIGVTALIFLLFHGAYSESPVAMINVLGLGLIYGLLRDRSGSTLPGMVGHLFNNAMAAAVLLNP